MRVTRRQLLAIFAVAVALVVVTVAAGSTPTHPFRSTAGTNQGRVQVAPVSPPSVVATLASGAPEQKHAASGGTDWTRLLLIIAVLIGVGWCVWRLANSEWSPWRGIRGRAVPDQPTGIDDSAPEELRDAIDDGLDSLERGPVSDAIIACWVRVETAVSAVGLALRPSETSTELVDRVLGSYGVRESALRRLSALYREARFSSHPMGEDHRREARTCLTDIQSDLAGRHAAT